LSLKSAHSSILECIFVAWNSILFAQFTHKINAHLLYQFQEKKNILNYRAKH
jgi:hypothetical protein